MFIDTPHQYSALELQEHPNTPLFFWHREMFACDHRPVVETQVQVPRVISCWPHDDTGDMEPITLWKHEQKHGPNSLSADLFGP